MLAMMMLLTSCLGLESEPYDVTTTMPLFPNPDPCVGPAILGADETLISEDCMPKIKSWLADIGRLKVKLSKGEQDAR